MHWAHPDPDDLPWHVYRKRDDREPELQIGDRILFYEGRRPKDASGKTITSAWRVHRDTRILKPLSKGSAGIVGEGVVRQAWREIAASDIVYDYGDLERWKWTAVCEWTKHAPLPLKQVWSVLQKEYPPQGFGLKSLSKVQYEDLLAHLRRTR